MVVRSRLSILRVEPGSRGLAGQAEAEDHEAIDDRFAGFLRQREARREYGADVLHHPVVRGHLPEQLVLLRRLFVDLKVRRTDFVRRGRRCHRNQVQEDYGEKAQDHGLAYSCSTVSGTSSALMRTSYLSSSSRNTRS